MDSVVQKTYSGTSRGESIPRKSKSFQNAGQRFSVLPLGLVVDLVANLSLSNLKILSKYFSKNDKNFLYTICSYEKDYLNYVIIEAHIGKIRFYGVNYQDTLLNCWVLDTVEQIPCTTVRGNIILHWRDIKYTVPLHIPAKCPSFQNVKASILSLFTLPSFTFILCNRLIVHLTNINDKLFVSFVGNINKEQLLSNTEWDFSEQMLIGKIFKNIAYLVNDSNCLISNQYPELRQETNQNIVFGSGYNYFFEGKTDYGTNTITYAYSQSFVSSEVDGHPIKTVYFKDFLSIQKSYFVFIGIVNPIPNGISKTTSSFAILGSSSFLDTKSTNQTTPLLLEYVFEKNDSFQEVNNFFFQLTKEKMLIYVPGFAEFLEKNEANQLLSRIFLYDSTTFKYEQKQNKLIPTVIPKTRNEKRKNNLNNLLNLKIKQYFDKLPNFSENKFIQKRDLSPAIKYFANQYHL